MFVHTLGKCLRETVKLIESKFNSIEDICYGCSSTLWVIKELISLTVFSVTACYSRHPAVVLTAFSQYLYENAGIVT